MTPPAAPSLDQQGRPSPDTFAHGAAAKGQSGLVAPAKALRLLCMLGDGLEELHLITVEDAARRDLIATHRAALVEVASTVSDPLINELVDLRFAPLDPDATVDEIRVAHAQLFGWLNGLILSDERFSTPPELCPRDVRPLGGHRPPVHGGCGSPGGSPMSTRIIGASVWEQELYDHFRSHLANEEELIAAYGELATSAAVPGVGYLAKLILADEQRHHQLFADLAATIEAEAESLADGSAVPSISVRRLSEDERRRMLALTDRFLALERADARGLEHLAKKLKVVKDTTLWHLLVELMRADTRKHIRILQFRRDHVRHGAV